MEGSPQRAIAPRWRAPRQWVRLRQLNGCNARFQRLRSRSVRPLPQVAVETAAVASPTPLIRQCHILEHEDARMMAQFVTT
jgi:FtsP/CotA-like multicopper oxidase with cupredoxin domain